MLVKNILDGKDHRLIHVSPDATVQTTASILHQEGIGAALVLNGEGAIAGIVSERDIVRKMASAGAETASAHVSDIMTREVICCTPEEKVDHIMSLMTEKRIRHVPVVEGKSIVGMLSIGDVVKHRLCEVEEESAALREYITVAG